jgi:hypothetical protein
LDEKTSPNCFAGGNSDNYESLSPRHVCLITPHIAENKDNARKQGIFTNLGNASPYVWRGVQRKPITAKKEGGKRNHIFTGDQLSRLLSKHVICA